MNSTYFNEPTAFMADIGHPLNVNEVFMRPPIALTLFYILCSRSTCIIYTVMNIHIFYIYNLHTFVNDKISFTQVIFIQTKGISNSCWYYYKKSNVKYSF